MQIRTLETVCSPEQFHHCHHHLLPRSACLLRKRVASQGQGSMGQKPWAAPLCCSSPKSEGGNPGPGSGITGLHGWGGTL